MSYGVTYRYIYRGSKWVGVEDLTPQGVYDNLLRFLNSERESGNWSNWHEGLMRTYNTPRTHYFRQR